MNTLNGPVWRRVKLNGFAVLSAVLIALGAFLAQPVFADPKTALEDYVKKTDGVFAFRPIAEPIKIPIPNLETSLTAHVLQVDSQEWRSLEEVDRTLWQHYLTVFVPNLVVSDTSLLFVIGSDNDSIPNLASEDAQALALFAAATGTVVSVVQQVPNQPLVFADDLIPNNKRREDGLVAFTFDRATRTGDYTWPAYLPMVKSVVRTMDAIQMFVPSVTNGMTDVSKFVVAGFSKRGATAWLTAAVDDRVVAVAPGVFDALNWAPALENHRASYGAFSDALEDYLEFDLLDRLRTPEGQDLLQVIDPYSYRDRLTMPKFIINSSGDEFFPPDSSVFGLGDMPGETLVRYLPNTNHGGDEGGLVMALQSMLAWYQRIAFDFPRPKIEWTLNPDGSLTVYTSEPPMKAVLWQAANPTARDFRFNEVGPIWNWTPLWVPIDGEITIKVPAPNKGWTGFFVELTYATPPGLAQTYSTQLYITPTETPFALDQPINNPRGAYFWSREFKAASGRHSRRFRPTYDADALQSFLPLRVFDQYISTVEEAHAALRFRGNSKHQALRQCLAVRLNIEAEKIDWYSPVRTFSQRKKKFLWRRWNKANKAFQRGRPRSAAWTCAAINFH